MYETIGHRPLRGRCPKGQLRKKPFTDFACIALFFFFGKKVVLINICLLVACYATLHPAMLVGWSVSWSVGRPLFTFLAFLSFLRLLLLPKCSGDFL